MAHAADVLPPRSLLFMPGSNARALEKAQNLPADALVFDLEDAVSPAHKHISRTNVRAALQQHQTAQIFGTCDLIVRINGHHTPWITDDLAALSDMNFSAVLLPKAESAADFDICAHLPKSIKRWAMVETPLGVLRAADMAADDAVSALVFGSNDLSASLGAELGADRSQLLCAAQQTILAARAHGCAVFDSVYNAYRDEEGFVADARLGKSWGFDGKSLIHPNQIAPCHSVYAPDATAVADATDLIAAYEATRDGVATHKGQMIEELHVHTARRLLAAAARDSAD